MLFYLFFGLLIIHVFWVNHKYHFVSPENPNVHTQNIERLWREFKRTVKVNGRPSKKDGHYLGEFLYRHKHRDLNFSEFFFVFLTDIARVYPGYGGMPID